MVLKALAKNPENRYQTAAEMRTDLIRVHSGEAPEAPKVFTDAERTTMLTATGPHARALPTEHIPAAGYPASSGNGSIGRWLIAVAVLAVLTVVVTIAINTVGNNPRDVQVPDVTGQTSADAIAALQNRGFKTRTLQKPDSTIPPDHVISTDPAADTAVGAGDDITINVSTGPEQRAVPDVDGLSLAEATRKLLDAGFTRVQPSESESTPELKGKVLGTNPPSNATSAITNVITVIVGTGPRQRRGARLRGAVGGDLPADPGGLRLPERGARRGRTTPRRPVRSSALSPTVGQPAPKDTVVQMQVSRGNQFVMPNLTGQFWVDAEPNLRALGWTGVLIKGANVDNSGQRTNAVVTQNPPAGIGRGVPGLDHPELRVLGASGGRLDRVGDFLLQLARPGPRPGRRRSSRASWPACGARPR